MGTHYNELQEYSKGLLLSCINSLKNKVLADSNYIDVAAESVYNQLIDDITLEVVAEYHRAIVKGYVDHVYPNKGSSKNEETCSSKHLPSCIHYDHSEKKVEDIKCPHCNYPINASSFARHLESCMQIGRCSKRIASRRNASTSKESNYVAISEEEDEDEFWSGQRRNKIMKRFEANKKKKENLKKQTKTAKGENRIKEESTDWLASPKLQLSPVTASKNKRGALELETEAEDTSATPSPADSNSTSSGSAIKRKDKVKHKKKLTKTNRLLDDAEFSSLNLRD